MDPARQRRGRGRPRRRLRAGAQGRPGLRPGRGAGSSRCWARTPRSSPSSKGAQLAGAATYAGPVFNLADREPGGLPADRRRLRHHRGGHRPGPHGPGLRRGRLRRAAANGLLTRRSPEPLQPGQAQRPLRRPRDRLRGPLGQGRRPDRGADRGPRGPRPRVQDRGLRARLSALLALRHAAALLRQGELVHPYNRGSRADARREREDRLAPRAHPARAASATGWRTTSTGPCRATATGERRCRSGAATSASCERAQECVGSLEELREQRRPRSPTTSTAPTSTRSAGPASARVRRQRCAAIRR